MHPALMVSAYRITTPYFWGRAESLIRREEVHADAAESFGLPWNLWLRRRDTVRQLWLRVTSEADRNVGCLS